MKGRTTLATSACTNIFYGENTSRWKKLLFAPYRPVLRTLAGRRRQRVLDVGCGSGHYLAIAQRVLGVEAYGIEPYSYDKNFAENNHLDIFNGTLEEASYPDAFFDVITLNHVLEHVSNPAATFSELRRFSAQVGSS